jgi:hypothetical protein
MLYIWIGKYPDNSGTDRVLACDHHTWRNFCFGSTHQKLLKVKQSVSFPILSINSLLFFHSGYNFPFLSRRGIIIIDNFHFDSAKLRIQYFEVVPVIAFLINSCFRIPDLFGIDHEDKRDLSVK